MTKVDIHKAAGIILQDKRLLVVKPNDLDFFISPGGSVEKGESATQAVIRELKEELSITVLEKDLAPFGTFYAQVAGDEDKVIKMETFMVNNWSGKIIPDNEIEQLLWVSSNMPTDIKFGSIFEHEVIPRLKERGLID